MFLDMFLRCVLVGLEMQQIKQDLLIKTLLQRATFGVKCLLWCPLLLLGLKKQLKQFPFC